MEDSEGLGGLEKTLFHVRLATSDTYGTPFVLELAAYLTTDFLDATLFSLLPEDWYSERLEEESTKKILELVPLYADGISKGQHYEIQERACQVPRLYIVYTNQVPQEVLAKIPGYSFELETEDSRAALDYLHMLVNDATRNLQKQKSKDPDKLLYRADFLVDGKNVKLTHDIYSKWDDDEDDDEVDEESEEEQQPLIRAKPSYEGVSADALADYVRNTYVSPLLRALQDKDAVGQTEAQKKFLTFTKGSPIERDSQDLVHALERFYRSENLLQLPELVNLYLTSMQARVLGNSSQVESSHQRITALQTSFAADGE